MTTPLFYHRTRTPGSINGIPLLGSVDNIDGLIFWVAASDLTGADGSAISSWSDRSQYENNLSQATEASKPTLKTNIINGQNVARFDGGDFMTFTSDIASTPIQGFAVVKPTAYANISIISGENALQWRMTTTGKMQLLKARLTVMGTSTTALGTGNFKLVGMSYNNPNLTFRNSGVADGSASSSQSLSPINLFGINSLNEQWQGDIAEVILFNKLISNDNISVVENYLTAKYAL